MEKLDYAIIMGRSDAAGENAKNALIASGEFEERGTAFGEGRVLFHKRLNAAIFTVECDQIFAENVDREIDAEVFIFASRHEAAAAMPTLSAHAPGNFATADFGGGDGRLCPAPAFLLKRALIGLEAHKPPGYAVTMEATHHGPFLEKPALFIEIGSTENEWRDGAAGRAIAAVIMELISRAAENSLRSFGGGTPSESAAAIGGPHYCSAFNKYMLDSNYAIGHVCPKYRCDALDEAMISQMAEKTLPPARLFLIDWKGVNSATRARIVDTIEKLGFRYERA